MISLARFMELALYCPVYGYYEKEGDTVGRQGDFYTSVSVGPLFGKLLAVQFADWLTTMSVAPSRPVTKASGPGAESLQLVEAGAHRGELAKDILHWFRDFCPALFERLEYWIIEPSDRRQKWQKEFLAGFPNTVKWAKSLTRFEQPAGPVDLLSPARLSASTSRETLHNLSIPRIIFCNELLDAMPVHRWRWQANRRTWVEWGITLKGEQFVWAPMSETPETGHSESWNPLLAPNFSYSAALLEVLPDGFVVETSPAAAAWFQEASRLAGVGKIVAMDYGFTREEQVAPERLQGSLRAYRNHHLRPDPLASPGNQDLTAAVDFTTLQHCGESAGLRTEAFLTQEQFLTCIAARLWKGELPFEEWTPRHTRHFQTLTNPEHFGRSFRVLIMAAPGLEN